MGAVDDLVGVGGTARETGVVADADVAVDDTAAGSTEKLRN